MFIEVSAADGEISKEDKYEALVEREGTLFASLVVESLCVWIHLQNALLMSITARITIKKACPKGLHIRT